MRLLNDINLQRRSDSCQIQALLLIRGLSEDFASVVLRNTPLLFLFVA